MKKIILYTPKLKSGGIVSSNKLLAKGFSKLGYEVIIISNRESDIKIDDYKHYYLNTGDFGRPFKLKDIILKEKPIAIFGNMLAQNISLSLAKFITKKSKNTKYFGFVRNSSLYLLHKQFYKFPYRYFVKNLYENLDKIIAVSSIVKEDLKNTFFLDNKYIKVIHDPLDLELINKLKNEPLSKNEERIFKEKTLLFVGRFEEQKKPELTLNIFVKVKQKINKLNLVFVGEGSKKEMLINKVKQLNIEKNVFLYLIQIIHLNI